ncbi:macrolide family glycosyltransferase [Actinosynnema sp. NPDC047251]|uniref:Glycosyltransferase, family 1 n=1 Tax=Saccharothrix espanaensis (strain ATCC 51144 / DSM 44229 / JCM 9112 / NBRC 15066 / NRRL 15764) TaxID=1179773 RepID=K0K5A7_SACES|nr:macrolide family glycosyltransferase [Saccharothrix espanaensis]CCH32039.1 Glycosyltransferase, family 1 [Saccharothrix espanaensis DSM 44229]
MPAHILFLSAPAYGHVYPTLTIAEALARRGHRVGYAVTEHFAADVERSGLELLRYNDVLSAIPAAVGPRADTAEIVLACMEFYLEGLRQVSDVEGLVDAPPDLVVFDPMMYGAAAVLGREWGVPTVLTHPNLAFNDTFDWPALRRRELLVGEREAAAARIEAGLAALFAEHGVDERELNAPTDLALVFVPREFQPHADSFGGNYAFVGPCVDGTVFGGTWEPPAGGRPVLFISLGTVHNQRPDFFRLFAGAFGDLDWHVVVTLGVPEHDGDLGDLPPNFEVHPWVPQLAVLEHAAVFLSNGGLGGVMSALRAGTPLLLAPEVAEQDMDAQRVVELGLGRLVDLDGIAPDDLRQAVLDLAADREIATAVTRMRDHVHAAGGTSRAADAIEARLDRRWCVDHERSPGGGHTA